MTLGRFARWLAMVVLLGGCGEDPGRGAYPLATFTHPLPLVVGEPAVFDASPSRDDGIIERYRFGFGDGTPVLVTGAVSVVHVFDRSGMVKVRLDVVDDLGNVGYEVRSIPVVAQRPEPCESDSDCCERCTCSHGRCLAAPSECRSWEPSYGCEPGLICCNGFCEASCPEGAS